MATSSRHGHYQKLSPRCARIQLNTDAILFFNDRKSTHATNEETLHAYLNSLPQERFDQAVQLRKQYDPASDAIDGLVCMPVDTISETPATLEHALTCYVENPPTTSTWEVVTYLNYPKDEEKNKKVQEMARVIDSFSSEAIAIHGLQWTYRDRVTMGRIRADLLTQAAIHPGKPWLATGHDADTRDISTDYFDSITDYARDNPNGIFFTTELRLDITDDHLPARITKYWLWLRKACQIPLLPTDANATLGLDKCLEAGGFDEFVDVTKQSETMDLYLRSMNRFGADILHVVPDAYLTTNPRRIFATVATGKPPHQMTVAGKFDVHNDEKGIRTGDYDPSNVKLEREELTALLNEMDLYHASRCRELGVTYQMRQDARVKLNLVPNIDAS